MKSIAVAVLHGIGDHGSTKPDDSSKLSFSKELHKGIRKELGKDTFDQRIAWREIQYSHLTQQFQNDYLRRVGRNISKGKLRKFVINNLGDAAAYQSRNNDSQFDLYDQVHDHVESVLKELENDTAPNAPLLILAHSLGGHVISNHIYDNQKTIPDQPTLHKCNTVASLVTFGCNIPLFTFGWKPELINPIEFPGSKLPADLQFHEWWLNLYDRDDVLGYPLRFTGSGYENLAKKKHLRDESINAGGFFTSWNPASHISYWSDMDVIRPATRILKNILRKLD